MLFDHNRNGSFQDSRDFFVCENIIRCHDNVFPNVPSWSGFNVFAGISCGGVLTRPRYVYGVLLSICCEACLS